LSSNTIGDEQNSYLSYSTEPEIEFQGGPDNGKTMPLPTGDINLGRQPDNDIVVDEPSVSRRHALITRDGVGYTLRDLGSTNGTFVNQQKVTSDYSLNHGDAIRLGASKVTLIFREPTIGTQTLKVSVVEPLSATTASAALVVDARTRQVYVKGQPLEPALPRKEFDLLMLLDSRRGEAISRDEIASSVWPERPEGDVGNHEIEQCVHRVRARIEENTSRPEHLVTIRGYGYKLST
jgi:pSer/pThr/pTyr-binding forkhead associated (FHA) protein